MLTDYLFTSESVSEGHPDKIADQISDAVLDAFLEKDPNAHVACETYVSSGLIVVGGEFRTSVSGLLEKIKASAPAIVKNVFSNIGYDDDSLGFSLENSRIITAFNSQSENIAMGVDATHDKDQGAGDQGLMFGYASNETDVLMPAPITFAHRLVKRQAEVRKDGSLPWLRPDAKSQITFRYQDNKPVAIDAVVLSTQHDPDIATKDINDGVMEEIILPSLPSHWLHSGTRYFINPTGRFVIGGPNGDVGLTGRKIIVDTYGGMARHGGGAFSGKDPSKVDRSAAYMGRHVAKNIVAAGLAEQCEIQISYAIGVAGPTSISIDAFGTGKVTEERLTRLVREHFDLRPQGLIQALDLLRPIYRNTAAYGHFGRMESAFSWENTDTDFYHATR